MDPDLTLSSVTLASVEHTAQLGRRERNLIVRNCGVEYAEKINKEGGVASAVPSRAVRTLIASNACSTPIVPTTGPKIPPSAQLVMLFAGGGFGKTQR